MRLSIGETAKLSGVTVRTLRHYEAVGLLCPKEKAQSGYRYYAEAEIAVLQQILLLKTLDFSLDDIKRLLGAPEFDRREALQRQRALLFEKRERLGRIMALIDRQLEGEYTMDFEAFDQTREEKMRREYSEEARERYGETAQYKESKKRGAARSEAENTLLAQRMDDLIREFSALCRAQEPSNGDKAFALVKRWQDLISEGYYPCGKDTLRSLGELYIADERFVQSMDRFFEGATAYISAAIQAYCAQ